MRRFPIAALALVLALPGCALSQPDEDSPRRHETIASTQTLKIGDSTLQVDFATGDLDLAPAQILPWIQRAAQAVRVYYGKFPVPRGGKTRSGRLCERARLQSCR